jgi:hypothetical protein
MTSLLTAAAGLAECGVDYAPRAALQSPNSLGHRPKRRFT